jgi:hypothetical protein
MPDFETWVDVDVDDFYHECNDREKRELAKMLIEDGFALPGSYTKEPSDSEQELKHHLAKISEFRLLLTGEEEETLKKIANRVCLYPL